MITISSEFTKLFKKKYDEFYELFQSKWSYEKSEKGDEICEQINEWEYKHHHYAIDDYSIDFEPYTYGMYDAILNDLQEEIHDYISSTTQSAAFYVTFMWFMNIYSIEEIDFESEIFRSNN